MHYEIIRADEYDIWFENQTAKSRLQITERLDNIEDNGHFGDHKRIDKTLWELRWKNGRRIYFVHTAITEILL